MQLCASALNKYTRPLLLPFAAPNTRLPLPGRLSAQLRRFASVSAAELKFGQPLPETHPHLLKPGERKLRRQSFLRHWLI